MSKKALVTGAEGFVGGHLCKELEDNGYEVLKCSRLPKEGYIELDILNPQQVIHVLNTYKPEYIFNLAALAFVPTSWREPQLVMAINHGGLVNLMEGCIALGLKDTVVQNACSSEEYGFVKPDEVPISEKNELRPQSPYAVSKIAADYSLMQYHSSYGLKTIRTRAFNHTGPGRGEAYLTGTLAKQIAMIEHGFNPVKEIKVGDLTSVRDFTDVRDTVRAYRLLAEKGTPGEVYNIGTGVGHTAQEVLDIMLSFVGEDLRKEIEIVKDPQRMRPSDVPVLICDCQKLKDATGWEPTYDLKTTLKDLLDYYRDDVGGHIVDAKTKC